jgi:hypothetical protein
MTSRTSTYNDDSCFGCKDKERKEFSPQKHFHKNFQKSKYKDPRRKAFVKGSTMHSLLKKEDQISRKDLFSADTTW